MYCIRNNSQHILIFSNYHTSVRPFNHPNYHTSVRPFNHPLKRDIVWLNTEFYLICLTLVDNLRLNHSFSGTPPSRVTATETHAGNNTRCKKRKPNCNYFYFRINTSTRLNAWFMFFHVKYDFPKKFNYPNVLRRYIFKRRSEFKIILVNILRTNYLLTTIFVCLCVNIRRFLVCILCFLC